MTNKNNFDTRITPAPIYTLVQNQYTDPISQNSSQKIHPDWQKWYQAIHNQVSSTNYYGYPSLCLNSNFYWNRGVSSPVTQADGDGAFFSEKWQVHGASAANYTLTQTTFNGDNEDNSGSNTYINVSVSSWNGNSFYLYQRQSGAQFLRLYQNRNMQLSAKIINNQNDLDSFYFEVYYYYDTGTDRYESAVFNLDSGINYVSAEIDIPLIGPQSIGATPYVEFRFVFNNLNNNTADFDLIYIKAEMSDMPTPLYVDAALEKTRIDNS